MKPLKWAAPVFLFFVSLLVSVPAYSQAIYAANQKPAGGVEISFVLAARNPVSHLYDVNLSIKGIRETSVDVAMPAWAPGAYTIRNYAKDIQAFRAQTERNQPLDWTMADKQTWRIAKQANDDLQIRYQVFSAQLTDAMADLSGPATFMYVVGYKHVPITVRYDMPRGWRVYTGLEGRGDTYRASDYDIFIDAPAFIGPNLKVLEFATGGASHRMVFSKPDISMTDRQVLADVQDIVDRTRAIFGGRLPYRDYTFLFKVQPTTGSGGLEHLNSTRITVGENDFVNQTAYQRFLFVVAHEFFHLWNVKRIRPDGLGPFDYSREVYTRDLWISEGITSYYAHVLLARAGIIHSVEFNTLVGTEINTLQHQPGRLLMSAEEASWNTWYRSENAANNAISYYTKGEIIGMFLDLEIRSRTSNQRSLDDVMRYLMTNYADKGIGFPEEGFIDAVEAVAGSDFDEFFQINAESREELNYDRYLQAAGLQVHRQKQPGTIHVGMEYERDDSGMPRIRRVLPGSPAERSQLDLGDVLVAMSGERLTFENFRSRLHSHRIGEKLQLTVLRGDRLLEIELIPIEFGDEVWTLIESPNPTPEQLEIRRAWLGIDDRQ